MKKLSNFLITAILATLFSFSACSGDDDVSVVSVRLNESEITLRIGETRRLTPTIIPDNATDKGVTWVSRDENIAAVTDDGLVRAEGAGSTSITVATNNNNLKATCYVTVNKPDPARVTLSKPATTILAGQDERISAMVSPAAADQSVTWSSNNPSVADIASDGNGLILAVSGPGTANITAITANGIASEPCVVTVTANNIAAAGVIVAPSSVSLMVPSEMTTAAQTTFRLTAVPDPPNATGAIAWNSSDDAKATVNAGLVTAIAAGDVDITATAGADADAPKGTCKVTIIAPVRVIGVTVEPATATIAAGATQALTATLAPANPQWPGVTWSSNNPCATVAGNGLNAVVTATNAGGNAVATATITATTLDGGFKSSSTVNVTPVPATAANITPASPEVLMEGTRQLTLVITPFYGSYDSVIWRSDSANANVSQTGLVSGNALGTATITAAVTVGEETFTPTAAVTVVAQYTVMNEYIAGAYNGADDYAWWGRETTTTMLDTEFYDYGEATGIVIGDDGARYVVGWDDYWYPDQNACLYRNNDRFDLDNEYYDWTWAEGVALHNGDVFTAGYGYWGNGPFDIEPYIWKNADKGVPLPVAGNYATALGIAVGADGVTHVVGTNYYNGGLRSAAYWKGNTPPTIINAPGADATSGRAIAMSGSSVYITGNYISAGGNYNPWMWKDGVFTSLPIPDGCTDSLPQGIFADGSTVYVCGYSYFTDPNGYQRLVGTLWVNGLLQPLATDLSGRYDSKYGCVYVYNGALFLGGYVMDYQETAAANRWRIVTWKDGARRNWTNPRRNTTNLTADNEVHSIFVTDK